MLRCRELNRSGTARLLTRLDCLDAVRDGLPPCRDAGMRRRGSVADVTESLGCGSGAGAVGWLAVG